MIKSAADYARLEARLDLALHNMEKMREEHHAQMAAERQRFDDLLVKYHSLRPHQAPARTDRPKLHAPAPPPEEVALKEAEDMAVTAMTQDFMRAGLSERDAHAEARRVATSFASSAPIPNQ